MSSLATLLRALLAVLLVSAGTCNAAEFEAAANRIAATELVSVSGTSDSHCEAHCEQRASSLAAQRDLDEPASKPILAPPTPVVVSQLRGAVQPRAPPARLAHEVGRTAVDDLRTVRLLI